ncbi:hypothetical protein [Persicobacter psychrovividus]|uniref:Outer membrane protein beta-barrel domain-containing protein n=1 Tax=Persicobacter psychrovividus TaxID=387638 RepID=A0ABN6L6U6_9BACT|nr:hypothetical protein PEPS_12220 [Persicobacter psychrovividus]
MKKFILLIFLLAQATLLLAGNGRYRRYNTNNNGMTPWVMLGAKSTFAWTEPLAGQMDQWGVQFKGGVILPFADRINVRLGAGASFNNFRAYEITTINNVDHSFQHTLSTLQLDLPMQLIIRPDSRSRLYFMGGYELHVLTPEKVANQWNFAFSSTIGLGYQMSDFVAFELQYMQQVYAGEYATQNQNAMHMHQNALSIGVQFSPQF